MYSLQSRPVFFCAPKCVRAKKGINIRAVQGIGDVVHVNVYESLTKRLDSIEDKLLLIEDYLNDKREPVIKSQESVPEPYVINHDEPKPDTYILKSEPAVMKSDEHSKKLLDLQAQMAEATSEARRNALQARITELSRF